MKRNSFLILLPFFLNIHLASFAQLKQKTAIRGPLKELKVGDTVPEDFFRQLPVSDSARLIILDFWYTGCISCIAAFPKMEKLRQQFNGELEVILVNSRETTQKIGERLSKINEKRKVDKKIKLPKLPAIDGDSLFIQLFPHITEPHHVWITFDRKVIAVTAGYNATADHVSKILAGQKVVMNTKTNFRNDEMRTAPLLSVSDVSVPQPAFYSTILRYASILGASVGSRTDSAAGTFRFWSKNSSILDLYRRAFQPSVTRILLEVRNKDEYFMPSVPDQYDEWMKRNCFSYEALIPLKDKNKRSLFMQADLNRFFLSEKGIQGRIEKRTFPCLILKKTDTLLLASAGGESESNIKGEELIFRNISFAVIVARISDIIEDIDRPLLFVNETGLPMGFRADMRLLKANLTDIEILNKRLLTYGLYVEKASREVEVLVIREIENDTMVKSKTEPE